MKSENAVRSLMLILSIFVLSASTCEKPPPPITPNFIDPVLAEVDEHKILDESNLIIDPNPIRTYPLSESKEPWFCMPKSQIAPWINYLLEKKKELEACK